VSEARYVVLIDDEEVMAASSQRDAITLAGEYAKAVDESSYVHVYHLGRRLYSTRGQRKRGESITDSGSLWGDR